MFQFLYKFVCFLLLERVCACTARKIMGPLLILCECIVSLLSLRMLKAFLLLKTLT